MSPSIWARISPIYALVPTTTFSILLISFHNVKFTGHAAVWIKGNPDSSAIIAQIAAAIFGLCQSYLLCSLINYAVRIRLFRALLIFTSLLSAFWAGAITPLPTTQQYGSGNISIPAYPNGFQPNWSYDYNTGLVILHCHHADLLSVSDCAVLDLSASLINSLRTATNPAGPRIHAMLVNATWIYSGRSYGVGSSHGLTVILDNSTDPYTAYSYFENGYLTEVSCERNASTNWTLDTTEYETSTTRIWIAEGSLPQAAVNNSVPYYITVDYNWQDAVAWTAASVSEKQGSTAVAAIGRYSGFYSGVNQTQCSVTFTPMEFYVAVNNTLTTIAVTPQGQIEDFEGTGTLVDYIMASFGLLSRISPNVVGSAIGDAIADNANNYNITYPGLNVTELILRTMEASFAAVIDDLLLGQAAGQLFVADVNSTVDVTKDFEAIHFGSLRYIVVALVLNSILIIILLLEGIRTRLWRDLPFFNPTNIKDVVTASSSAVTRSRLLQPHSQAGDRDDEALLRSIRVKLDDRKATLNVVVQSRTSPKTSRPASQRNTTIEEDDLADLSQHTSHQDEEGIPLVLRV